MPARSSSLIPDPLGQLIDAAPTTPDDLPSLLTCLAQVPDPQRDQGRRHPLAFVLSLAACAVLAGAKSLAAIAEWAADAPPHVLARLGGPCREPDRGPVAPAEATVSRILQRVDGDALDTAVGSRFAELVSERQGRSLIITSNRAPSDWYPLFPNPVVAESLLDRLINTSHQVIMNGPSYRPNKRPKTPSGKPGSTKIK